MSVCYRCVKISSIHKISFPSQLIYDNLFIERKWKTIRDHLNLQVEGAFCCQRISSFYELQGTQQCLQALESTILLREIFLPSLNTQYT